jgi:hypothetical protein
VARLFSFLECAGFVTARDLPLQGGGIHGQRTHRCQRQQVSHAAIGAAMRVHTNLGPGLLKSTYTACLQYELGLAKVRSSIQVGSAVVYDGAKLEHHAQILSYLKLSGKSIGLLINLNVVRLKDGIKRFVNGTGWN